MRKESHTPGPRALRMTAKHLILVRTNDGTKLAKAQSMEVRMNPAEQTTRPQQHLSELRQQIGALRPLLYARALRLARSPSRAEDIVQEAMLRALRFEHQYQAGTNLKAWTSRVLTSVFLTECRKYKRERRAFDALAKEPRFAGDASGSGELTGLTQATQKEIRALPKSYRDVIETVDLRGHSYREAAQQLGVPMGTVMSRLHRARKQLASKLVSKRPNSAGSWSMAATAA
jgi:RNA polymerase sigma-70 factor, ECF subfamily